MTASVADVTMCSMRHGPNDWRGLVAGVVVDNPHVVVVALTRVSARSGTPTRFGANGRAEPRPGRYCVLTRRLGTGASAGVQEGPETRQTVDRRSMNRSLANRIARWRAAADIRCQSASSAMSRRV